MDSKLFHNSQWYEFSFKKPISREDPNLLKDVIGDYQLKINSLGFKSDEFTKDHIGQHLLFAGCSVTYADGIPLQYSWSKLLYDYLNKQEKASGYFNIAGPGMTIVEIVMQIFIYIAEYGKPDKIFVFFPDIGREKLVMDTQANASRYKRNFSQPAKPTKNLSGIWAHNAMKSLVTMCKLSGIDLYISSWSNNLSYSDFQSDLALFGNPYENIGTELAGSEVDEDDFLFASKESNKILKKHPEYKDLIKESHDGTHPGILPNLVYFSWFKKEIIRRQDESIV